MERSPCELEINSDSVLPSTSNLQLQEIFDFIEARYQESISLNDVTETVGYSLAYLKCL